MNKIKELRIKYNMTQEEAASFLNISRRSYQTYENMDEDCANEKYNSYVKKMLENNFVKSEGFIKRKVALVTGSAKGIGRAIIKKLASNNYDCVINYYSSYKEAYKLASEIKEYGINVLVIKADVSKENEVDEMFNKIERELGGVDILVNNAAIDISNLFNMKTVEDFKKTLDINLIGAYIVSKRAYKHMMDKKWGRVINISSTNGINTYYPVSLEYDASKAALNSLTHNLAIQFSPYATVNAIAPGFIGTESELDGYDEEFMKMELEKILLGRFGKPEEVASLVNFLVSDEANYINNSIIRIDGGQFNS